MPTTIERDGMKVVSYNTKETAAELRKTLREQFPGTKFSVRMARGTGYGWLHVSWTDGPSSDQVTAITDRFASERYDGMSDCYVPVAPRLYAAQGEEMPVQIDYSCCGVNSSRSFSDAAREWAAGVIRAAWPAVDTAGWTSCPVALLDEDIVLTHEHGNIDGHVHEFLNKIGDLTGREF